MKIKFILSMSLFLVINLYYSNPAESRYYSANTGRFLQRDPIGYDDGMNPYAYTQNNPINYTDPLGLLSRKDSMWSPVHNGVKENLNKKFNEYKKTPGCGEVSAIPGENLENSLDKFASAFADELKGNEVGFLGGDINKNREKVIQRLREKHPDWPWENWDKIFK